MFDRASPSFGPDGIGDGLVVAPIYDADEVVDGQNGILLPGVSDAHMYLLLRELFKSPSSS